MIASSSVAYLFETQAANLFIVTVVMLNAARKKTSS